MKALYIAIGFLVIISAVVFYLLYKKQAGGSVFIKGKKISVELALTASERQTGLSERNTLSVDSGMLFVFPKSDTHTIWMKKTSIPLDVIWIDSNNRIVDFITLDPESENNTPEYTPKEKAKYVLEVNAGLIEELNIQIGDPVTIKY